MKYMKYSDNDKELLLDKLREFYKKNGRVPAKLDFNKNSKYPTFGTYYNIFGSWDNAIELAGLDFRYNETDTCDICGEKLKDRGHREYKNNERTGRYLCDKHYNQNYYSEGLKKDANRRIGNLDPNSSQAKGDLGQGLTCKWLTIDDLNVINDNYMSPIDHSKINNDISINIGGRLTPLLGLIPQTKVRFYDIHEKSWKTHCKDEWGKEFDILIFYCFSKSGKDIERIYIIPEYEITGVRGGITIIKNPTDSRGNAISGWYEPYRVTDEETIRNVNDMWHKILEDNGMNNGWENK